jgi:DNA-binding CsgD family transcriptional regulator
LELCVTRLGEPAVGFAGWLSHCPSSLGAWADGKKLKSVANSAILSTEYGLLSRVTELPDKLLDLLYDAATEEELWTPALIQIADMTRGVGGNVFGADNKARRITFYFNGRLSEEAYRAWRERHMVNPLSVVMNYSPVGKLVRSDDILRLAELKRTAVFDEVFRPQDVAHLAMLPLAAKHDFQVGFSICRSERQGHFEAGALRLFTQLYPHLRRSLLLGFRLDGYKALQRAEFHTLDRLSVGIVLLDRSAQAIFVNAAARTMTAYGGPLRLHNSVLTAFSQAHSQRLGKLIGAAVRGVPVGTMSIPHPRDDRLFTILVSSVRSRDIDRFSGLGMRDVAAMLVIHDPACPMEIPVEWIMDAYGLTLAEARVALCAASGATIPEAAHMLNVSPNTIKTHLRKVFAKTGTSRQSELARVIASIALLKPIGSATTAIDETSDID